MAKLNLNYYKGQDLYSDGDVENEILELVQSGMEPGPDGDVKFPVLYHLSGIRENILNWYPFDDGARGLEIGSGCGAITGILCRRLARVVSVELSKRRADINFARHRELSNLEIRVGNLNDMEFETPFDYVILNGVFEYAMSFTEGKKPYETFLRHISRFLKPDGIILVAIENRLGLKYFAGAPEDHTDGYFDGIREYEGNTSVRTFSRGEWEELMRTCGFDYYKFYYPYPDYKFPREIFTDASLKTQKYGRPAWNFTKYRMALFEETKMAATLQREGVMAQFANSFLIEMSRSPQKKQRDIVYAKLGTDRDERFSIGTVIEERRDARTDGIASGDRAFDRQVALTGPERTERPGNGEGVLTGPGTAEEPAPEKLAVVKFPVTAAAEAHLQRMQGQMADYGLWRPLAGKQEGTGIVYPFLNKKSLADRAALAIQSRDKETLKGLVDQVATICRGQVKSPGCRQLLGREISEKERQQFREVFGAGEIMPDAECIAPANIDLILDNIFEENGSYEVIDCEWIFDFPVPVSFILWRAINELYSNAPHLEQFFAKQEFMEAYGITEELSAAFWKWATHFAENYVGANRLLKKSVPEIGVSLEEFRQRRKAEECITSQLFVDTGNGFSEEEKLTAEMERSGSGFLVRFDLKAWKQIRALRFDPLEGRPCICRIDKSRTTSGLRAANAAAQTSRGDLFLTTDPIYQVMSKEGAEQLTVCGELTLLTMEEALAQANELLKKPGGKFASFWRKL